MFIVSAEVLPMSRYTARFRAKAATALLNRIAGLMLISPGVAARSFGSSRNIQGTCAINRNRMQACCRGSQLHQ